MELTKAYNKVFLADIDGQKITALNPGPSPLAIIIGPEGGFAGEEIEIFKKLPNLELISLGPILLRAETAALAAFGHYSKLLNKSYGKNLYTP